MVFWFMTDYQVFQEMSVMVFDVLSLLVKPKWEFSMSSILKVWYQGGHHREYQVA